MGIFKNIVTFGASGRIERKMEEYEDLHYEYKSLMSKMERKKREVNTVLENVVKVKVKAVKKLNKISKISKNLKGKDREFLHRGVGNDLEIVNFNRIDETLSVGQAAINATKGLASGIGTAAGAWALVSTLGTASTGTAIAGLSGAAGLNATLAWFGGGSLAVGGGGMAAGTAVLGGLIAIPALALTGIFSHLQANKKINEMEKAMNDIVRAIDQIESNILQLKLIEDRSEELIQALQKAEQVFITEFKRTYKEIYRFPLLSRSIKWIRKYMFRKNYFSKKDLISISYIGGIAGDFAILIDTKVFED